MKNKIKLFFVSVGGFLVSVAPLVLALTLRFDQYVQSTAAGWRLGTGGMIVAVLILLKVLGRLKLPSHVTTVAVVMLLSWLLAPLLSDLTYLCAMYLLGDCLDLLLFRRTARRLREAIAAERQADATAGRVEELLKNYMGKGGTE